MYYVTQGNYAIGSPNRDDSYAFIPLSRQDLIYASHANTFCKFANSLTNASNCLIAHSESMVEYLPVLARPKNQFFFPCVCIMHVLCRSKHCKHCKYLQ